MSQRSTALSVSMQRAAHYQLDPKPHIVDDPVAWHLLSPSERSLLERLPALFTHPLARVMRQRVLLRQFYVEERLEKAVRDGVAQYVILGAGMDSFALRQPVWAAGLAIFEVDRAVEQEKKLARMHAARFNRPHNTKYLAADFESDDVRKILLEAGFSPNQFTLFACLGVLIYLSPTAIQGLLSAVLQSCRDAELVLTVAAPPINGNDSVFARLAAGYGESWMSPMTAEDIDLVLRGVGWPEVNVVDNAKLAAHVGVAADVQGAARDGARIILARSRSV